MQIKKQIGLVFFIILALVTSSSFGNSAFLRDFGAGDVVVFGYSEYFKDETESLEENLKSTDLYAEDYEIKYNFTEVDDLLLEYTAIKSYAHGHTSETTIDFSVEYWANRMLDHLFSFSYSWDDNYNRVVLTYFEIYPYYVPLFIEPNWGDFNTIFKEIINTTTIIDSVYNGIDMELITLGDFLDDILSYKIQGASNVSQGP